MSNYYCNIKIRSTGDIEPAEALDNYFSHGVYGYKTKDGNVYHCPEIEELETINTWIPRKDYRPPVYTMPKKSWLSRVIGEIRYFIKHICK